MGGPETAPSPTTLQEVVERVLELMQGRLYKEALKILVIGLKMDRPKVERMITQRFQAALKIPDWEEAITWGNALFRIKGEDADLANQMGNCARQLDKLPLANDYYRHGLKQDPNHKFLRMNLAASLAKFYKYDAEVENALAMFDTVTPPLLPEYTKMGRFIDRLAEDGSFPDFVALYDAVFQRLGEPQLPPATQLLDDALATNLYNLSLLCLKNGDGDTALPLILRLRKENKLFNGLEIMEACARHCSTNAPTKDRIEGLKELLLQHPKDRFLLVNLGLLYREDNNWLQSMKYLLTAVDLLEQSQGLYGMAEQFQIAEKQYQAGEKEKSVTFFQVVAEQQPRIDVYSRLGEILFELDRFEESLANWLLLKEHFSETPKGQEALEKAYAAFMAKADQVRTEAKASDSVHLYGWAAQIKPTSEAYKSMAQIYHLLKDKDRAYDCEQKQAERKREEEAEALNNEREKLVAQGKAAIQEKKYNEALDFLKQAFILKKDKDVFVLQAYLLKNLKRPKALAELMASWKAPRQEQEKTESEQV